MCYLAVSTPIDCSDRNGGCEYTCVRGNIDTCSCPAGLTLSPSNRRACVGKNCVTSMSMLILICRERRSALQT